MVNIFVVPPCEELPGPILKFGGLQIFVAISGNGRNNSVEIFPQYNSTSTSRKFPPYQQN